MKILRTIIIAVTCLVLLGISLTVVGQLIHYRSSAFPIYPIPDHPEVTITSPVSSSQHTMGSPVLVQVTASGPNKVEAVELYVNSMLVGTDTAPPGGSHFYQAEFLWSPPEEGEYIIIAKAIGFELMTGFSSSVHIEITAPPTVQDGGESVAYPNESFPGLGPEGAVPPPDTSPIPGEKWKGSLENWFNSLRVKTPPSAPELAASTENCTVTLSIHDLSDNEEGFEIWRSLPNSPTWSKIASLDSQSQEEWIGYTDTSTKDKASYFVSAFNSQGVRSSNLVQVNLDPRECMPKLTAKPTLVLELEKINFPVDVFYCYFSLDGEYWSRSPQVGFWPVGDTDQQEPLVPTEILSMSLPGELPNSEEVIAPMTFYLDCWGWGGGSLKFLGAFTQTLSPNQKGEVQAGTDGVSAAFNLKIKELPDQPEFYPMGGSWPQLGIFDDSLEEIPITNPLFKTQPIEGSMPWINAFITDEPGSCQNHLPPQYQNENSMTFFCDPLPGFHYGPNGANPQLYLNWDPNAIPRCPNGQGQQCKDYYYWTSYAADLGHEVGFNVYDNNIKGFYFKSVTVLELFNYRIPTKPCTGTRELWVQMWYYDGTTLLPTYGPPSNKVSIPCPVSLGPKMFLDVRFDDLVFSNLDDDEPAPQDVEVFGYMRASSESMTRYLNLAKWNELISLCPSEDDIFGEPGSDPGCPISFTDGVHQLIDKRLCRSEHHYSCSDSGWDSNNNTIRLVVEDGDSLTLSVKIIDKDSAFATDLVCEGTYQVSGQSVVDWHGMEDEIFMIQGSSTNSGSCHIFGTMNAVSP